jgi:hypothetical protein
MSRSSGWVRRAEDLSMAPEYFWCKAANDKYRVFAMSRKRSVIAIELGRA